MICDESVSPSLAKEGAGGVVETSSTEYSNHPSIPLAKEGKLYTIVIFEAEARRHGELREGFLDPPHLRKGHVGAYCSTPLQRVGELLVESQSMLLSTLVLLLIAAVLHALANLLMKKSRDKIAFVWWMNGFFCLLSFPILFFIPDVKPFAWLIVLISGCLEAIYFFTLTRAYTAGDLSLVYPVARGSAPLFILLWAILFLGERPTWIGVCGIGLIVAGLYLVNLSSIHDWSRPLNAFRSPASRWALLTGILISGYSAIDKVGIRYFPPFVYLYLFMMVSWICLSIQWLIPSRRAALMEEPRNGRLPSIIAGAVCGTVGYSLVLTAMRLSPVSYVGPVREISVVIGTWIGIRFLGEQGGSLRITASVLVVMGIALITIFG